MKHLSLQPAFFAFFSLFILTLLFVSCSEEVLEEINGLEEIVGEEEREEEEEERDEDDEVLFGVFLDSPVSGVTFSPRLKAG